MSRLLSRPTLGLINACRYRTVIKREVDNPGRIQGAESVTVTNDVDSDDSGNFQSLVAHLEKSAVLCTHLPISGRGGDGNQGGIYGRL